MCINKGAKGKGMGDKGALQRQESWLGWWSSIPRFIFDRHIILWNSYRRFHQEWILLRAEPTRLLSLHELPCKNFLQMNCCIICCAYSTSQSVQSIYNVRFFATSRTTACQASLSNTNSQSLLKFMSIELVMLSNHLILCHPLILLPSIFPSIRVFSDESGPWIKWPSIVVSASASVLPEHLFRTDFL